VEITNRYLFSITFLITLTLIQIPVLSYAAGKDSKHVELFVKEIDSIKESLLSLQRLDKLTDDYLEQAQDRLNYARNLDEQNDVIRTVLHSLTAQLTYSTQGDIFNYVLFVADPQFIPFYLVGRDSFPESNYKWADQLPEVKYGDPQSTLQIISEQKYKLIKKAKDKASEELKVYEELNKARAMGR
jgi:hypothetical protein